MYANTDEKIKSAVLLGGECFPVQFLVSKLLVLLPMNVLERRKCLSAYLFGFKVQHAATCMNIKT